VVVVIVAPRGNPNLLLGRYFRGGNRRLDDVEVVHTSLGDAYQDLVCDCILDRASHDFHPDIGEEDYGASVVGHPHSRRSRSRHRVLTHNVHLQAAEVDNDHHSRLADRSRDRSHSRLRAELAEALVGQTGDAGEDGIGVWEMTCRSGYLQSQVAEKRRRRSECWLWESFDLHRSPTSEIGRHRRYPSCPFRRRYQFVGRLRCPRIYHLRRIVGLGAWVGVWLVLVVVVVHLPAEFLPSSF